VDKCTPPVVDVVDPVFDAMTTHVEGGGSDDKAARGPSFSPYWGGGGDDKFGGQVWACGFCDLAIICGVSQRLGVFVANW
jgi:hypothetical protein